MTQMSNGLSMRKWLKGAHVSGVWEGSPAAVRRWEWAKMGWNGQKCLGIGVRCRGGTVASRACKLGTTGSRPGVQSNFCHIHFLILSPFDIWAICSYNLGKLWETLELAGETFEPAGEMLRRVEKFIRVHNFVRDGAPYWLYVWPVGKCIRTDFGSVLVHVL